MLVDPEQRAPVDLLVDGRGDDGVAARSVQVAPDALCGFASA
jgi:hypothetical protein